ncbi:hypothetical protein ASB57_28900 [Bordetella sp. N]|nr:hypothetical protein ASB57_28900 [Bordetella sp. N]
MMMWEFCQPYPGDAAIDGTRGEIKTKFRKFPLSALGGREAGPDRASCIPAGMAHGINTVRPKAGVVRSNASVRRSSMVASQGAADSVFSHREPARAAGNIPIEFRPLRGSQSVTLDFHSL